MRQARHVNPMPTAAGVTRLLALRGQRARSHALWWTLALSLVASSALVLPATLAAQATIPGAANIEPTRIRYGTLEYVLSVVREGEEQVVGSLTDEILPLRTDEPVIRRVQTTKRSGGVFVDSTVTDAQTLAPRWHHAVVAQRDIFFEMDGLRVRGRVTNGTATPKVIDATLPDAAFDASNWDLAVRALPLEESDAAFVQVYDVDQQVHRYGVRVVDRELRGKSWIIHVVVQLGKGSEAHVWFDDVTRTLLRIETPIGPDVLLRQVLRAAS